MTNVRSREASLLARALGADVLEPWIEAVAGLDPGGKQRPSDLQLRNDFRVPRDFLGRIKAVWELAEFWRGSNRPAVGTVHDALLLLEEYRSGASEHVVVLMLDARNRHISTQTVSVGSINASRLQPRDVFAPALTLGASSIIVAHNHPSGDVSPSRSDLTVTAALRDSGELLGIPLVDHLILSQDDHYSFRESEGWLAAA